MKVYYGTYHDRKLVYETGNEGEAFAWVADDIDKHQWKSYYQRFWKVDGVWHIDYGSHTHFYFIDTNE